MGKLACINRDLPNILFKLAMWECWLGFTQKKILIGVIRVLYMNFWPI